MSLPAQDTFRAVEDAAAVSARMQKLAAGDWLDRCGLMAVEHLLVSGKALRARLAAEAARALGAREDAALGWATCCELLHEASLVHDDLQDGDTSRRGAPTVWARYGAAQAINVGDLLILLATSAVREIPVADELRWRLASALAEHAIRAVRGQAVDLALGPRASLRWSDWERASDKTAALFELPVCGAVLLAGGSAPRAQGAAAPFGQLGRLYQLRDDVLDLYGDKGAGRYGSDVRAGRVTALVVQHLELWPEDQSWLEQALGKAESVDAVRARFRDAGTLEEVLDRAYGLARAVIELPEGPLAPLARALLERILTSLRALDGSLPATGAL
jgi:geranylgeranyl diphosphate synthase type I